jgi:hypothetical protein
MKNNTGMFGDNIGFQAKIMAQATAMAPILLNRLPPLVTTTPMQDISPQEENNLALKSLQELCEYPVLYVNMRVVVSGNPYTDKNFAITVSNKEPEKNEETLEVIYPADSLAADIFFSYDTNTTMTNMALHWAKLVCSILTFRGHEVFFNNKIFLPFENQL